jgi:6-phosphogluconolactonase (cycloisomerase 2 family)
MRAIDEGAIALVFVLVACNPAGRDAGPQTPSPGSAAICTPSGACGGTRRFAYVSTHQVGLLCYAIQPVSGALTRLDNSPCLSGGIFTSAAAHPSGRFLYVTSYALDSMTYKHTDEIRGYAINPTDGSLTEVPGSRLPAAGWNPVAITLDPLGRFVYMANYGSNDVSAYAIEAATGSVAAVSGSPFAAGGNPNSLAVEPTGRFLYVANEASDSVSAYSIDARTGALTSLQGSPFPAGLTATSIAIHPSGRFAYVANLHANQVSAFAIDGRSGELTKVPGSPYRAGAFPTSVIVEPSGRFAYVTNSDSNTISAYSVDPDTGALTNIAGSPFPAGAGPYTGKADPSGKHLYISDNAAGGISVYAIDATSGRLTSIPGSPFTASGSGGAGTYSITMIE